MIFRETKEIKASDQPVGVDSSILDNVEEMTRFKVSCIKLKKSIESAKAGGRRRTHGQANTKAIIYRRK